MVALRKEELLGVAEKVTGLALLKGATEAEAFAYQGSTSGVSIERGQIAKASSLSESGIGLRVIIDKSVGFSYTNVLDDERALEQTVFHAIDFAKASKPDKDWLELPEKSNLKQCNAIYDQKIATIDFENLTDIAFSMLNATTDLDKRVFAIEGGVGASCLSVAVANSNDISVADEGTAIECSIATLAQEANEVTPVCFEFNAERTFDIDPLWVGREAAKQCLSALKAKKDETRNASVILTQFPLQQLMSFTFIDAINAEHVQRDRSALKGKIGQQVASTGLSIVDDGLLDGGLRTWPFDGEGVPQQKTPILDEGILKNFIYDNYTAKKERKKSTGNGARAGYLSTPSPDVTNFHILPGKEEPEDLIEQIDDGLLVSSVQGAHSSNPASGDFSVVAAPAWKIRRGEIVGPIKGAMISGNMFRVVNDVSSLANNERKIGQLVTPWIRVENVRIIGK